MGDPVSYINSYADLLKENVDVQFRKPVIDVYLEAVGEAMQVVEQLQYDLQVGCWLENAIGVHLAQYGDVVGESKLSLDDRRYRDVIRAKVLALKKGGLIAPNLQVFKTLLQATEGSYTTAFPAAFRLAAEPGTEQLTDQMRERVTRIMRLMIPPGYDADYVERPIGGSMRFDTAGHGFDTFGMGRRINSERPAPDPGPDRLSSGFSDGFSAGFR